MVRWRVIVGGVKGVLIDVCCAGYAATCGSVVSSPRVSLTRIPLNTWKYDA